MQYWHELVTFKSWEKLQELKAKKLEFVLIGGWACYLWAKSHKSKDIDVLVDLAELARLKAEFSLKKNTRLKKYEFSMDGISIDVYVLFYSKFVLPAEYVVKNTVMLDGFRVPKPEVLLLLKQQAELERKHSEKGLKDRIDIIDLLVKSNFDFEKYLNIVEEFGLLEYWKRLVEIVNSFREASYLGMGIQELKREKKRIIAALKAKR